MLYQGQQTIFLQRDTTAVAEAFSQLPTYWQQAQLLRQGNRYGRHCIQRLTADLTPGSSIKHRQLAEYIAASTIIHCLDGWAYFGRALHAQLVGDHDCARHLAYYAELRAAMGLLASQGIGVFDKEHIVISRGKKCLQFPPLRRINDPTRTVGTGTHKFVWDALEEWSNSPSSTDVILNIVSAGGSRLRDWVNHFGAIPALASQLTKNWLESWGLDIARLADDRDARNLSSYRPTSLSTCRPPNPEVILQFISGLWRQCEPSMDSPFALLDCSLVKASLQRAFRIANNRSPNQALKQYRMRIKAVLNGVQPKVVPGLVWEDFFLDPKTNPLFVLKQAAATFGPEHPQHSLQVASRALLLLRLASGAGQSLIKSLPINSAAHLSFWISTIGCDRALWPPGQEPATLSDLWMDTETALDEIHANLNQVDSFSTLWRKFANSAQMLASWERVGLWGLGL